MFLESNFDVLAASAATKEQIVDLLESLGEGTYSIAILGTAPEVYVQACYLPGPDAFSLDFRDGGPRRHYAFTTSLREVMMSVFLSYHRQDDRWRTMVEWERDGHYELIQG